MSAVAALASLLCIVGRSSAQTDDAELIQRTAAEIAASVSSSSCSIVLRGAPRFDGLENTWLVAYMAAGGSCDAASAELRRLGKDSALVFFRRPDSNQVRALITNIRASVQSAFHCPITLRGEPRFDDDSGYWTVTFLASGPACGDVDAALGLLGADYQIRFQSATPHQGFLP